MDLRSRNRARFSGFTRSEIGKMEMSLKEKGEHSLDQQFCKKLSGIFNRSNGRAGKPAVKWTEVHKWLQNRHENILSQESSDDVLEKSLVALDTCPNNRDNEALQVEKAKKDKLSKMEFEARSSKDDAWYDVESFHAHRFLGSGEGEVKVRFIGFGPEEDEWISVKKDVRERSIALEDSECNKVQLGDVVLCFQEQEELARYHDARIIDIQRRHHDIRGCRCLFTIRYNRDNTEESVSLKRICFRPSILGR